MPPTRSQTRSTNTGSDQLGPMNGARSRDSGRASTVGFLSRDLSHWALGLHVAAELERRDTGANHHARHPSDDLAGRARSVGELLDQVESRCHDVHMREQESIHNELPPMDPAAAAAALTYADQARTKASHAVLTGSAWTSRFLGAFGVTTMVCIILTGVLGAIAYIASWVAFGVISTWFARRERVSWRGFDRLSGRSFRVWLVLQSAAGAVGFNFFVGEVAYWIPVAFVVSAPMFVGAWYAAHR